MGQFLRHFLEWYSGIAVLAFLFLWAATGMNLKAPDAFFKALLWPIITCEYVDTCNQKILGGDIKNNIDLEK